MNNIDSAARPEPQGDDPDRHPSRPPIILPTTPRRKRRIRRSPDFTAHPLEERFKSGLFIPGDAILTHDGDELLDYINGLLSAASAIIQFAAEGAECTLSSEALRHVAVHGFLSGSLDLMWLFRERCGGLLPRRIRITRGLAHKLSKRDRRPIQELNGALNGYLSQGVNRLVVIDEVNSGGQMGAALKRVRKWLESNRLEDWSVLAIGMTELSESEFASKEDELRSKYPWATIRLVHVPSLLAYDNKGVPIKPIMSIGTKYVPYRFWGGGYEVRCKNTLLDCSFRLVAATDTASGYSSTVRAICRDNPNRPKLCWPEKSCSKCAAKVAQIRHLYEALPQLKDDGILVGKVSDRHELFTAR